MTKGTFNNGEEIHESKDIIKDFFFFFFFFFFTKKLNYFMKDYVIKE